MTQACALPGSDAAAFPALPFFFSTFLETGSQDAQAGLGLFMYSSQSLPPSATIMEVYHHPSLIYSLLSALLW